MMRMLLMILMMMTMAIHRNPGCTAKLGLVALPVQTLIKVFNLFQKTFTRYIADGREGGLYKLLSTKYIFIIAADGFFAAVGTEDWLDGFACGTCAQLYYRWTTLLSFDS